MAIVGHFSRYRFFRRNSVKETSSSLFIQSRDLDICGESRDTPYALPEPERVTGMSRGEVHQRKNLFLTHLLSEFFLIGLLDLLKCCEGYVAPLECSLKTFIVTFMPGICTDSERPVVRPSARTLSPPRRTTSERPKRESDSRHLGHLFAMLSTR